MNFFRLFSPCVLGHDDPVKVWAKGTLILECPRCQQVIRVPLPKQKYKARKTSSVIRPQFGKRKVG